MDKYVASTKEDLINKKKTLIDRINANKLFKYSGEFKILEDSIEFCGFRNVKFKDIVDIALENDDILSSLNFATQRRPVFAKSAKPIRLMLKDKEIIYFYVNWNILTGLSSNKKVYDILSVHINK